MSNEKIPDSEAGRYVQRGESLAQGSRSGGDRRQGDRGLATERRYVDQQRVRRQFIDRVTEMCVQGCSHLSIAEILNDEGLRTAADERWTTSAIEQLLKAEDTRRKKEAWRPKSLTSQETTDP